MRLARCARGRLPSAVVLLLHLLVVGLVPLADGGVGWTDRVQRIGAVDDRHGSTGDDHLNCQLCRTVRTASTVAPPVAPPFAAATVPLLAHETPPTLPEVPGRYAPNRPRAPPIA
jgi:hypothetical protein